MSTFDTIQCFPGKTYYTNGMTATLEKVQADCEEIQKISPGQVVKPYFNDSTPMDSVTKAIVKLVLGFFALACAQYIKREDLKMVVQTISGALILWAVWDYTEILHRKLELANTLVSKVNKFLTKNPWSHVTLIFHSQGADIGFNALTQLGNFKKRIRVISLGGMVKIPDSFAGRVVNYQDVNDYISKAAQPIFSRIPGQAPLQINTACTTFSCHGVEDYIPHHAVTKTIRDFSQPVCYLVY